MSGADPEVRIVEAPPSPWPARAWLLLRFPLLIFGVGGALTAIALRCLWLA